MFDIELWLLPKIFSGGYILVRRERTNTARSIADSMLLRHSFEPYPRTCRLLRILRTRFVQAVGSHQQIESDLVRFVDELDSRGHPAFRRQDPKGQVG